MSSPDTPADDPDTVDMLAAEFVLGTLPRGARLDVEDRRVVDALLDERVRWWEQRLMPLALTVPAVAPSADCQRRIVRRVRLLAAEKVEEAADSEPFPVDRRTPSRYAQPVDIADLAAARQSRAGYEESAALGRWRAFGIAAGLTAVALGVLTVGGVGLPGAGERPVDIAAAPGDSGAAAAASTGRTALSLLRDDDGQPRFIVEIRDDESVSITALDRDADSGATSLQLWMADGVSGELRPVGLLPSEPWSSVQLEDVPLIDREPAFAVSEEPVGGSPEAGPTGDVVFQGTIHPIADER